MPTRLVHCDRRKEPAIETDWLALWAELATATVARGAAATDGMVQHFRTHHRRKTVRRDTLRDFVMARVDPGETVLDIGAGTGRWTIPLARATRSVTALEPTAAMEEMLRANLDEAGLQNVAILTTGWDDPALERHDVVVAAHSMYSSPDLAAFVRRMEGLTRTACYMQLRVPPVDGIIGTLTQTIHGRLHDSPNAVIAYNALFSIGIYVNLLMEHDERHWTDDTLDDAFWRAKRHLQADGSEEWDDLIRATLAERLVRVDEGYWWPDAVRSALLWWEPAAVRAAGG